MNHKRSFLTIRPALRSLPSTIVAFCIVMSQWFITSVVVKPGWSLSNPSTASCRYRAYLFPSCNSASDATLSAMDCLNPDLPRLHAQHAVTRLPRSPVPPSATATLWSTSSWTLGALCPQYWQVYRSRASTCQRSLYHPLRFLLTTIRTLYTMLRQQGKYSVVKAQALYTKYIGRLVFTKHI